jgi:hypothetical protein
MTDEERPLISDYEAKRGISRKAKDWWQERLAALRKVSQHGIRWDVPRDGDSGEPLPNDWSDYDEPEWYAFSPGLTRARVYESGDMEYFVELLLVADHEEHAGPFPTMTAAKRYAEAQFPTTDAFAEVLRAMDGV